MAPETLKAALRKKPFAPFRLVQSDGTGYKVRHPDLVSVGLVEAAVGLPSAIEPTLWERFVTVDLRHVICLEPLSSATQANGPG